MFLILIRRKERSLKLANGQIFVIYDKDIMKIGE
jgi:hypothetical protein